MSQLKMHLDQGLLPPAYFIIGDEAFVCTNQLLVPYGGRGLGTWKDSFNFHLSVMRQCIERSFALLTQRWGILWRPLRCEFIKWPLILTVCAKLHNYCLDANIPLHQNRFYRDVEDEDDMVVMLNEEQNNEYVPIQRPNYDRRLHFAKELELKGIRRPSRVLLYGSCLFEFLAVDESCISHRP